MTGDIVVRFWANVIGRIHGPLMFRFLLQPTMAMLFAIRDGVKDARAGRPAYLWTLLTRSAPRREMLREGMAAVQRVLLLAFVPYMLMRGPANRAARLVLRRRRRAAAAHREDAKT